MHDHARCTPLAQHRARKTIAITTRVAPSAVAQIEAAARSLDVPRHRILQAALRLGVPLAIGELTAQSSAAAADGEE